MNSYRTVVPLFDIDLTLLRGGARGASFEYAIKEVFGVDVTMQKLGVTSGMIDPEMLCKLLQIHGYEKVVTFDEVARMVQLLETYYLTHYDKKLVYEYMPGVTALLPRLAAEGYLMGVLSGNVEKVGWAKLRQMELDTYFAFGVFGNLYRKRSELSAAAKERVKDFFPVDSTPQLVVVGDSSKDISAAHEAGLPAIGVAAGDVSVIDLEAAGADGVINSLEDFETLDMILQKVSR
jgi:phosphoglycolate phosphatase-like HAD superfamily hydrolase